MDILRNPPVLTYPDFDRCFSVEWSSTLPMQDSKKNYWHVNIRAEQNFNLHNGKLKFLGLKWVVCNNLGTICIKLPISMSILRITLYVPSWIQWVIIGSACRHPIQNQVQTRQVEYWCITCSYCPLDINALMKNWRCSVCTVGREQNSPAWWCRWCGTPQHGI